MADIFSKMNKVNLSIQGKFVIQSLNLSIHTHNAKLQLGRPIEEAFMFYYSGSIVVIQSLGQVQLLATPWTAACQASLPFTISWSLLKHIHWVRDAIQPSHSLLPPSPAFSLFHHQGLLQWVSTLYQVVKVLELQLQLQSFQWIFRVDILYDWMIWSPCCPRDSQESSPAPVWKHQFLDFQSSLGSNSHICTWLLEKP